MNISCKPTTVGPNVPLVGNVTFVAPVDVSVIEFAPDVTNDELAASVNVPVPDVIVFPL